MSDKQLRHDIVDELDYEPSIDAAHIGVAVEDGVATLTGHVRTLRERLKAVEVAESVRGVHAVADELEIRIAGADVTEDDEVAHRIVNSLNWNTAVPAAGIQVTVANGWVTLAGEVEWRYQSEVAEQTVSRMAGVRGIDNRIAVRPMARAADITDRIRKVLLRDAEFDASGIRIAVNGGEVTLEGHVHYLGERRAVERAAWTAPGVTRVIDRLTVL